jgi:hypothetical protein
MKISTLLMLTAFLGTLAGCTKPIPAEKTAYVGEWQEKTMSLVINEDGTVQYRRVKGAATTSINAPLKGFAGDNFEVGVGPMATTFVVSKPPYQDGDNWKMVVDDVTLVKSSN